MKEIKEYNYNDPLTIASVFEAVNKVKKQTNESQINEGQIVNTKLLSIGRIILIGTQYSKSIQKFNEEGIITEHINPVGFTYKTENNEVILEYQPKDNEKIIRFVAISPKEKFPITVDNVKDKYGIISYKTNKLL